MSFFTSILKDKKDDGADGKTTTAPSTSNQYNGQTDYTSATITTTSGKQYTLDRKTIDWIQTRYRNDGIDSYGFDDADQQAKRTGQMSAAMRSTYTNSNVDQQLMQMGLPSEKYLEKYLDGYGKWHTGGIADVYGDAVPADFWTKTKDWYKNDWVYEDTPEDQQRKAKGLMPTALAAKYTDTELDDDLMARGLPSYANMKTYAQRYDNYKGIDAFYANAAGAWTNLRLRGIKNDDGVYTDKETGETKTGTQWYADAFYDTLEAVGDDGQRTYGGIMPLFRNNHATASEIDEDKDYITERGKAIAATSKAIDAEGDYAKYDAFSYDDFAGKYEGYYDKYYKNYQLGNGKTVDEELNVMARDEDEEAVKYFYDIEDKWLDGDKGIIGFVDQYQKDYPDATPEQMFDDMFEHDVGRDIVHKAMRLLQKRATKNNADDGVSGFYDISAAYARAEQRAEQKRSENPVGFSEYYAESPKELAVAKTIEDFANAHDDTRHGEWSRDNAMSLFKSLDAQGASPSAVRSVIEDEASLWQLAEYVDEYYSDTVPLADRENDLSGEMKSYVAASKKRDGEDEATIEATKNAILRLVYDEDGNNIVLTNADSVLEMLDTVAQQDFTNPVAMQMALQDLGFSEYGVFSGLADDLTNGWSTDDLVKLRLNLGGYRTTDVAPEDQVTDADKLIGDTLGEFWAGHTVVPPQKVLNQSDFAYALEWAHSQIAAGRLTEGQAYNILASNEFQDEMQTYMPEEWHRAHFVENTAPAIWAQSEGTDAILWEEMTAEERREVGYRMWEALTPEQKEAMYGDPNWWKYDPNVYRSFGQALEQQFSAIIPALSAELISAPVTVADAIAANITGRPERWEFTENLDDLQRSLVQYGAVADPVNGTKVADIAASATQELLKMSVYGQFGGAIGTMFEGTAIGGAIAKAAAGNPGIVKKAAKVFLGAVKASPFVVGSFAQNYNEAKELGAPNSEATWFGLLNGISEGLIEGFNVDQIWSKAFGSEKFGKMLLEGTNTFLDRMGIKAKALLSSMAVGFLGEGMEEGFGYVVETASKMHYSDTWGKGTKWSAEDAFNAILTGGLIGALGAGLYSGSMSTNKLITDYALSDSEAFRKVFPDLAMSIGVVESLPDGTLQVYEKGGAKIMSMDAYKDNETQMANIDAGIENAAKELEKAKAKEKEKLDATLIEIEKNRAKALGVNVMDSESVSEFVNLCNKLGIKININGDIRAQVQQALNDRVQEAQAVYDTAIDKAEGTFLANKQQAENQRTVLEKKKQEHFVGLYLANKDGIIGGLTDQMVSNIAQAYQNGATYDPNNQPAAVDGSQKVEGQTEQPANTLTGTTDAAARQTGTRVLTDDEIGQINDIANRVGFRYGIDFINDPDNVGDAWFDKATGRITINQANITAAEAEDLVGNPGFWLLRHEWSHYIEGSKYYSDYLDTVSRLQMNELGTGGYNAAIQHIIQERAQKGISLGETAEEQRQNARMELAAKYAQGRLFTSQESIDAFVREQKGVAVRLYNWLQYVIDRGKLRRQKNSAEARAILEAERMYAKAFRAANINPASITDDGGARLSTSDDGYANPFGLSSYTLEEERNIRSRKNNIIAQSEKDIRDFFDNHIMKSEEAQYRLYCGKISEDTAARIKADTGVDFDLTGASVVITSHLEKSHVDEAKEASRGQVQITGEILSKVPEAIRSFTSVEYDGETADGRHAFKFELDIDGRKIAVEYYSAGRNVLTLQTIYGWANKKNPTATIDAEDTAPLRTSEATADSGSANTVAPKKSGVKSQNRRASTGLSYDDYVAEFGQAGDYVGTANPNTGVTAEEDEAYMRAAMSGDTETAKRMVRELYERNGWTHTYRGEPKATGSWTQVDMDKFKAVGMFSSPDLSTAQAPEYTQSYAKEDLKTKPLSYGDEMPVLQAFADGVAKRVGKGLSLVAESYYMDDEGNTFTEPSQGREHHWALRDARTGDIFADSTELTTLADATKRKAARLVGGNPQNVYNSISDPFAGRILDLFVRFDHANEYNARGDEWDKIHLNGPKGVTLYRIEVTPDTDAGNTFTVTAYPIDESFDAESSSASERAVKSASFTSEDDFDYAYNLENAFRDLFGPKSDVIEFFEENAEWDGEGGAVLDKVGVRDKNGRYVAPELFPEAETTSTDALAARDKTAGYDGTIIRNVRDGGPSKATDYVSFNPNYIKSADAITYDDNGNIIPLSQRGDTSRNNLRYSTGTSYDDLLQQYGAKDQGMDPRARDIQVPERVSNERRLSDFIRSLLESGKVTEDQVREIEDLIVNEDWGSYIPTKDEKRMERARAYIAMRQPLQAQQEFHDMVTRGKYGADTNALGLQLLADAAQRGDTDSVLQISADLQVLATEAGQSVQIFSVLKRLGGVGSAVYMQKVIDRFNSEYADQIQSGKMQPIAVDPALMQQLASAKTTKQIAAAEEAVAKAIGAQLPLTFTDRASAWRYFAMLANPTTHFRNITGNVLMAGLNTAKDAVATGLENVLGVKQDDRAHAILTAKDRSTWGRFAQSSFEDQQRNLQGGGKLGFETFVKQNMRSFDTKWLNALAKFNFNALEGEDLVFIRPAYKNALMEYMKAQGYTLNAKGEAGKVNAKGEFTAITQAQMNAAVEWASNQAWKATFRDASSLATMLNKISKENAVSRLLVEGVMPFKKTPINIARRGIEYSPAGIIMGTVQLVNGVKKGKVTTAQAIDNLASGITGTALMAVGMFLAKAGVIRAGGEDKKKYETYLEDTGDQTYSLKFGDASINLSAIAPATIPLFMGVALMEALDRNDGGSFDFSTFTDTMAGTLNPFMEMSFMSSLNSALQNYNNNGIGGALGNTLLTAAENYGSQYLPTVTSKLGQFIDPVRRTTKSDATSQLGSNMDYYVKSLFKKVPGLEATLQPDVDVWGRTDVKDSFGDYLLDFANKFILPTTVKIANRDVVDDELIRLVESTGSVDFLPSDGNKYFTVGGQKFTMNAKQYTQFSQDRGQASYAALKEVMGSAAYQRATDEEKAAMLEKALKAAQKQVNTRWKEILGALD